MTIPTQLGPPHRLTSLMRDTAQNAWMRGAWMRGASDRASPFVISTPASGLDYESDFFQDGLFPNEPPAVHTVYMTKHSWITLAMADPRPLYLQVIEQVRRRVAVGDLTPGTELPSIRELAASLRVSVITIKRAYFELEREGVIVTRQGKGSVIAERHGLQAAEQEREIRDHLQQAVDLGLLLGLSKTEMQKRLSEVYELSKQARGLSK